MPDQVNVTAKGGTMRLGRYPCVLAEAPAAGSCMARQRSPSATATATSSTTISGRRCRWAVCGWRACPGRPPGRNHRAAGPPWFVGASFTRSSEPSRPAASAVLWVCQSLCGENGS
ncbi:MAG: hypothetical protein ACLTYN_03350 [Dysosmobacter welbionis]